jgi:ABC-type branched-subunit amino acid transport system substrate-binding protein
MMKYSKRCSRIMVAVVLAGTVTTIGATSASGAGTAGSKSPIRLVQVNDNGGLGSDQSFVVDGARAAAKAVNKDGGVDGHPIKIIDCQAAADPNKAEECGRDAVTDEDVAFVGSLSSVAEKIVPIAAPAGIPTVAPFAVSFPELTDPSSYPITGTSLASVPGSAAQLADAGAEKIHNVYTDVAAGAFTDTLIELALEPRGMALGGSTPLPLNAPDMTTYVQEALSGGTDAIMLNTTAEDSSRFIVAARQAGFDGKISVTSAVITPDFLEQLGDAANGMYVANLTRPGTQLKVPAVRQMVKEFKSFKSDLAVNDSSAQAWAGVHLIAEALTGATTLDGTTLQSVLNQDKDWDLGIIPPVNFTKPVAVSVLPDARIFNLTVLYTRVKDGKLIAKGDFIDPSVAPS